MKSSLAGVLLGFVLFDVVSFSLFRSYFSTLFPNYGGEIISTASRGYPRYHFIRDEDLGFDIRPNFETSTKLNPPEYGSYNVWGNEHGCFDNEWGVSGKSGGIYMAGDSFTWGYATYSRKFSTLLQERLGGEVYACGVTHTGQRHQFQKFLRLYNSGIRPSIVIVNVTGNDIENDFFFPISTVVNGFLVENIRQCGAFGSKDYSFKRLEYDEMERVFNEKQKPTIRSFLKQYSAGANIFALATKKFRNETSIWLTEMAAKYVLYCYSGSDFRGMRPVGDAYIESDRSKPNKLAILKWIAHSHVAGYDLIFSFIPGKINSDPTVDHIAEFINKNGGETIKFTDYISDKKLDKGDLYFRYDGHFNEEGNLHYANFLASSLEGKAYVSR